MACPPRKGDEVKSTLPLRTGGSTFLKSSLEFSDHRDIGSFYTKDYQGKPKKTPPPPAKGRMWETVPEEEWVTRVKVGMDAIPRMDKARLILFERAFFQLKMKEFSRFLASAMFFRNSSRREKPHIVISEGQLADVMMTLVNKGKPWRLCAVRSKGTTFLSNLDARIPENPVSQVLMPIEQYANTCLRWRLCSNHFSKARITEWLRVFCITQVRCGEHQILLLHEADGFLTSTKGSREPIKARTFIANSSNDPVATQRLESLKFFRWWAQCVATGIRRFAFCRVTDVLGLGQGQPKKFEVNDFKIMTPSELWARTGLSEKAKAVSFTFLDKVLTWIKETMKDADEAKAFAFKWDGNEEKLTEFVEDDVYEDYEEEISPLTQQIIEDILCANVQGEVSTAKHKGLEKPEEFLSCDVITDKETVSQIRALLVPSRF